MLNEASIYRGGLPVLPPTYRRQRGSGFLSAIGRFAMPILKSVGKAILPSVAGGVGDLIEGSATPMEILKRRAAEAGKNVIKTGVQAVMGQPQRGAEVVMSQPPQGRKRPAQKKVGGPSPSKRRKKKQKGAGVTWE